MLYVIYLNKCYIFSRTNYLKTCILEWMFMEGERRKEAEGKKIKIK